MVYLEYILLAIIIILVYILINKITVKKEGFEHNGNGFIAAKPNKEKNIKENEKLDEKEEVVVTTVKTSYKIAELFAFMIIRKPWEILSQGITIIIDFVKNLNEILQPIKDFIQQMFNIFKKIVKQIYNQFAKGFKQIFTILRNMPAFIKKYANIAINFMNKLITQLISILEQFIDVIKTVVNAILELPNMFFNIISQATTFGLKSFTMAMKIPEAGLKFGINIQDKIINFMDKQ
jgi:phage-related protein